MLYFFCKSFVSLSKIRYILLICLSKNKAIIIPIYLFPTTTISIKHYSIRHSNIQHPAFILALALALTLTLYLFQTSYQFKFYSFLKEFKCFNCYNNNNQIIRPVISLYLFYCILFWEKVLYKIGICSSINQTQSIN